MSRTSQLDFSKIYQRIKFNAYEISEKERIQISDYLRSAESTFRPESHAALLVFSLSSEPTSENVKLVQKFLTTDADDYARSAAVNSLYGIWHLGTDSDVKDLRDFLLHSLEESRQNTSAAAIGCAFELMHIQDDRLLSMALGQLLENLHGEVVRENDFAMELFISACLSAHNKWARSRGQQLTHFSTIEDALPVYWDRQKYLLEPIN